MAHAPSTEDLRREGAVTGRVLTTDEIRHTSGISEAAITALVDGRFARAIRRVTSADTFLPLDAAANLVLLAELDIEKAATTLATTSR